MKTTFLVIAGVLTVISALPYIIDILKNKTKPNPVSWLTWTILGVVGAYAAYSAGEVNTAIFSLTTSAETLIIVILGYFKSKFKYEKFDIYCQVGALSGLLLWWIFDSPLLAIFAVIIIDFIGALPTLRHCLKKPFEETWQAFAIASIGGFFAILSLHQYNLASFSYPIYIFLINIVYVLFIIRGRKIKHED